MREREWVRERERFGDYVTSLFTEVIKHDGAEHGRRCSYHPLPGLVQNVNLTFDN